MGFFDKEKTMKVLRILFIVTFLSTLFIIPAQAQGGGKYGFLALVTQARSGVPLETQARQAFNRLAPQLLAAQKNGTIVAFEPDLSAGILKIEYAAGAHAAVPAGLQGLDDINAAAALVPHATSAGPVNELVITPAFSMNLFSSCFSAAGLGASSHVIGSLRDKNGVLVSNLSATASASGTLFACFDYSGPFSQVVPGDKIAFNVYDGGNVLLGTFTATTPAFSFTAINKTTSVVSGLGPKNKAFALDWWHPNLDAANTAISVTQLGTVSSTGKWSADLGTIKIRGNDELRLYVAQNSAFSFNRYIYVSATYCEPGSNYCGLNGFPAKPASLTIVHAGVTHTFTGHFDSTGWFSANLVDSSGVPIFLKAGDKISGTGIPAYSLPNLTALPNYSTDVVSGKSPANNYTDIWVRDVVDQVWNEVWTKSNAAGNYSADYSLLVNLVAGQPYGLEVYYTDPITGNQAERRISVGP